MSDRKTLSLYCIATCLILLWSGWAPYSRSTWWMEVAPVFVVAPILVLSFQRFRLTPMLYLLIFLHACVLMIGGKYTYARVPLGFQISDLFGLTRNPYDKIGHFMQGFVPAIAMREILLRGRHMARSNMLVTVVLLSILGISATYELIEWVAALALGQGADEFLGTQGYVWDTQSDMAFALLGAVTALVTLSAAHNHQLGCIPGARAGR